MLWLVIILVAAVVFYVWRKKTQEENQPLTFDTFKADAVAKVEGVKAALDVNKDGVVTIADAVEAGKKVAKKATTKTKTAPKAKKPKTAKLKVAK